MKSINLNFISFNRTFFMGVAIFWIFFYHTGVDIPVLRQFFALGWLGVDIFFFISGFGLCSSLLKDTSVKRFYARRFKRIIPTWWIILAVMALLGVIASLEKFPETGLDYFYWFSGLGWWTGNCNFEWYIPTLLIFYLVAPFLARQDTKTLLWLTGLTAILAFALASGITHIFDHVYMSYSRLPIFIFGFYAYKEMHKDNNYPSKAWFLALCIGVSCFVLGMLIKESNLQFGLTIARVSVPLFIIPFLFSISLISSLKPLNKIFQWLGIISLEVYLLHINHQWSTTFQNAFLSGFNPALAKVLWFGAVLCMGYALHLCMDKVNSLRKPVAA